MNVALAACLVFKDRKEKQERKVSMDQLAPLDLLDQRVIKVTRNRTIRILFINDFLGIGSPGMIGIPGMRGPAGLAGEKGEKGLTGTQGPEGPPGRIGKEISFCLCAQSLFK